MKKIACFDASVIESLKYMLKYGMDKEDSIRTACRRFCITDEFMGEFGEYIDAETFSKSYMLPVDMIKKHENLFNVNLWLENEHKDPMIIFDEWFFNEYSNKITDTELSNCICSITENINRDQFMMYYYNRNNASVINNLLNLAADSLSDDDICNIIVSSNSTLSCAALNNRITPDIAKKVISEKKNITLSYLLANLVAAGDIGFAKNAIFTEREYETETGTDDKLWCKCVDFLPEDSLCEAIRLAEIYSKSSISYRVLARCLKLKEFEEDDLIGIVSSFKRNNLITALANYAKVREYDNLLTLLVLDN